MLLVFDRDNYLHVFESVAAPEGHLEAIDVELGEYEFCDETGQPYVGEMLRTVEKWQDGEFRIVPRGERDPALPHSFLARAAQCYSKLPSFKNLQEARPYFATRKT
jgi:hypothetical protein